jgi:hypothetical protein
MLITITWLEEKKPCDTNCPKELYGKEVEVEMARKNH